MRPPRVWFTVRRMMAALTAGERRGLSELIAADGAAAQELAHSPILLKAA